MCHAGAVTTQLHRVGAGLWAEPAGRSRATRVTARSASRNGQTITQLVFRKDTNAQLQPIMCGLHLLMKW